MTRSKVFIAGQPLPEIDEACKQAGLDGYVHMKTNTYQLLYELQEWLKGGNE